MTVTGRFATPHASRYLQQLCKHFAHKIPVTFDATHGEAEFQHGRALFDATGDVLTMTCTANAPELEPMLVKVVAVHLERFAWKEGTINVEWTRDGKPATDLMTKLSAMPDPHRKGEDDHHDED